MNTAAQQHGTGSLAIVLWIIGIIGGVIGAVVIHPAVIVLAIAPTFAIVKAVRS
jgi:hypothetical protein